MKKARVQGLQAAFGIHSSKGFWRQVPLLYLETLGS